MNIFTLTAKKNIITFFILFICCSCYQDVIDIDLSEIKQKIVIEGTITDQPGPYTVKISKTVSIYQASSLPKVSGANVIIYDDSGNIETLREIEAGVYQTSLLQGVPGRTYTLRVIAEGKEYLATSIMPVPVVFYSIDCEPNQHPIYELSCSFRDHEGIEDYCRIKFYRNGEFLDSDHILYQDAFTDGELIVIDDLNSNFYYNDFVEIELLTIEKDIYEYFSVLLNFDEDGNSEGQEIIGLAPTNPRSNINNNALGYFSAQTYRKYELIVR